MISSVQGFIGWLNFSPSVCHLLKLWLYVWIFFINNILVTWSIDAPLLQNILIRSVSGFLLDQWISEFPSVCSLCTGSNLYFISWSLPSAGAGSVFLLNTEQTCCSLIPDRLEDRLRASGLFLVEFDVSSCWIFWSFSYVDFALNCCQFASLKHLGCTSGSAVTWPLPYGDPPLTCMCHTVRINNQYSSLAQFISSHSSSVAWISLIGWMKIFHRLIWTFFSSFC